MKSRLSSGIKFIFCLFLVFGLYGTKTVVPEALASEQSTQKLIKDLEIDYPGSPSVRKAGPKKEYLATWQKGSTIQVWNRKTKNVEHTLSGHQAQVTTVDFSPDGTRLASAGWDSRIIIWDLETGERLRTIRDHSIGVLDLEFSSQGYHLVSGGADQKINIWNTKHWNRVNTFENLDNPVNTVDATDEDTKLAGGMANGSVRVWDYETGDTISVKSGHTGVVNTVRFGPKGKKIVSSGEKRIVVWNSNTGNNKRNIKLKNGPLSEATIGKKGNFLIGWDSGYNEKLWYLPTGKLLADLSSSKKFIWTSRFNSIPQPLSALRLGHSGNGHEDSVNGLLRVTRLTQNRLDKMRKPLLSDELHSRIDQVRSLSEKIKSKREELSEKLRQVGESEVDQSKINVLNSKIERLQREISTIDRKIQKKELQLDLFPRIVGYTFIEIFQEPTLEKTSSFLTSNQTTYKLGSNNPKASGDYWSLTPARNESSKSNQLDGFSGNLSEPIVVFKIDGYNLRLQSAWSQNDEKLVKLQTTTGDGFGLGSSYSIAWNGAVKNSPNKIITSSEESDMTLASSGGENILKGDELYKKLKNSPPAQLDENRYLFAVGISDYASAPNVPHSRRSAMVFRELAHKKLGIPNDNEHMVVLLGNQATGTRISGMLRNMVNKLKSDDKLIFYYSGHGVPAKEGDAAYILPQDAVKGSYQIPTLKLSHVYNMLSQSKASQVNAFVDACFSGRASKNKMVFEGVAPAGRTMSDQQLSKKVSFNRLNVLTAGKNTQFSNSHPDKKHRLFSYYLVEGLLKGFESDKLVNYVQQSVTSNSLKKGRSYKQEPQVYGTKDFNLF